LAGLLPSFYIENKSPLLLAEHCKLDGRGCWDTLRTPVGSSGHYFGLAESNEHDPNHDSVGLRRGDWSAARIRGGIGEAAGDVGGIYKTSVERED
jgi:hypothetical protein